jgi:hypothetical protein
VKHDCCNDHDIPAGQNCYIQSGVYNGEWYNYYKCEFCNTVSEILINNYNNIKDNLNILNGNIDYLIKRNLKYCCNITIKTTNIDLINNIVSCFTYNEEEVFNISFDEFYKIITEEKIKC